MQMLPIADSSKDIIYRMEELDGNKADVSRRLPWLGCDLRIAA